MFERLTGLGRQDPERAATREQRRTDRAARRTERKQVKLERSAADLDAEARHYASLHQGNIGGGNMNGPGS
jgi:hypothetical protein